MKRFFEFVETFLQKNVAPQLGEKFIAHRPKAAKAQVSARSAPQSRQSPYWVERGWKHNDGVFKGLFKTRFGFWEGFATMSPSGRLEMFIHDPPKQLERHPHWQCFRRRSGRLFFVHPIERVPDLSAGIMSIEKTIAEAYEL